MAGLASLVISGRREGTNVHMCGDGNVAERWISGYFAMENSTVTEPEEYRRLSTHGGTSEWRTQYTENRRLLAAHVLRTHGLCEFGFCCGHWVLLLRLRWKGSMFHLPEVPNRGERTIRKNPSRN